MAADVVDRARKLIALTASPNEHEAAAAALAACKLIREHNIPIGRAPKAARAAPAMPVPRCKNCGEPSANATGVCTRCQRAGIVAIWHIRCGVCGDVAPPGRTEAEVSANALRAGFSLREDGVTICRKHRR